MARTGLPAGDLEGLVDLDGDPLAAGRGQVGLVDAVGVGLDSQDGRPRVLGQRRRLDLGGGVAGEQVLVRPLALGLVDVAARPPAVTAGAAVGGAVAGYAVGAGLAGGGMLVGGVLAGTLRAAEPRVSGDGPAGRRRCR